PAAEIDAVRRQRLLDHRDKAVRERAARVFAGAANPDRQKVIDSYAAAIARLTPDAARGQKVFAKTCSVCHKLGGVGNDVGPDLASLSSTGKSAMPDGLEKDLSPQDLADVMAHLRGAAPAAKPKAFEGNKPELVKPAADGSLKLTAANAAIYGPSLVLEKQFGN